LPVLAEVVQSQSFNLAMIEKIKYIFSTFKRSIWRHA